uniref:Uncharacterized protein n=1 Tax=Amphimedon queenslandica TaxID=400682 RepID=A0A1X7TEM6_AMPQE
LYSSLLSFAAGMESIIVSQYQCWSFLQYYCFFIFDTIRLVDLCIVQWWYYSSIRNSSSYQTLTSQEKVLKRGHKRRVPSCCIL